MYNLDWTREDLQVVVPVMLTLIFFSLYWFVSISGNVKDRFFAKYESNLATAKHILFTKYFGFFAMGIFPLMLYFLLFRNESFLDLGLGLIPDKILFSLKWIVALSVIVIPLAYISARKPENLKNYPQIRSKVWSRNLVLRNALAWSFYLLGYEILFRGILLFPLVEAIGVWPAIAVNIGLYSGTHIPKGLAETIGAAPLGLVLCLLTLMSGMIWIAVFVHIAMALTNSFSALHFHPDMKIDFKNKS